MVKLYQAGLFASTFNEHGRIYKTRINDVERWMRSSVENYLESYHYIHSDRYIRPIRKDQKRVFLDSGAFSAFSLGVTIDIGEYCDYIHEHADIIEYASVLDSIGDWEGTWKNQVEMERRGVQPLPCFHYGEPLELLQHYVENYPYITLGGMVPISTGQLRIWLDDIWSRYLTDDEGKPKLKVHGFGLTAFPLVLRYPWYSVDSSTWIQGAAHGSIFLPISMKQVQISARSGQRKVFGQHLDTFSPVEIKAVEKEIESFCCDPDRMRDNNYARWAWNSWAFPYAVRDKKFESDRLEIMEQGFF